MLTFIDLQSSVHNDEHTLHVSLTKEQPIKDGSDLGDAEQEIESSGKLYNETQLIIDK